MQWRMDALNDKIKRFQSKFTKAATKSIQLEQLMTANILETRKKLKNVQQLSKKQLISQWMIENLINDLMDQAKMDKNQFKLDIEYFNLLDTIHQVFEIMMILAHEYGVELYAQIDDPKNLKYLKLFRGDKRRYIQIFLNFLSNAVKFTDRGGSVTLRISIVETQEMEVEDVSDEENQEINSSFLRGNHFNNYYLSLKMEVIDTGIGISEENVQKLFLDFNKLDDSSKRNKTGTGLGLSVCKKIVEQMGGSVNVNSVLNKGTTFKFNLATKSIVNSVDSITLKPKSAKKNPKIENKNFTTFVYKKMSQEHVTSFIDSYSEPLSKSSSIPSGSRSFDNNSQFNRLSNISLADGMRSPL